MDNFSSPCSRSMCCTALLVACGVELLHERDALVERLDLALEFDVRLVGEALAHQRMVVALQPELVR